jgi:hypothetical protein
VAAAACHGPSSLALVGPGPVAVSDGPGDYADDMECVWNITSVGPITIVFKAFSTEAGRDFLTVVDGKSGDVLRRYTGTALPAPHRTNATSLRVVFTSDGGVSSSGFELEAFGLVPGGSWAPTALPTTSAPTGSPTALPTWAAATGALGLCCATITHATPIAPHEHKMCTCERRLPRTCATRTLAVIL